MENISQLVESSLARHGVTANFDHLRLQWTSWFRCESSFSVLLAPSKPGIFALGEEVVPPAGCDSKRMLGLFDISDTDDLGMALGRQFLPGNPLRERLSAGRCFVRYAVVEDAAQRQTATAIFQRWMQESTETASGIQHEAYRSSKVVEINKPSSSFAWGMEVQEWEAEELKRPQPLPSGF